MMNIEDDCCPCGEPDYGVFGDQTACQCPCHYSRTLSPDHRRMTAERRQREANEKVSRDFNSHMINLYNEARRRP